MKCSLVLQEQVKNSVIIIDVNPDMICCGKGMEQVSLCRE